jgi:hypothetical protein
MKAKTMKNVDGHYVECCKEEATHLKIYPPGPIGVRILPIITHGVREGTSNWTWNGDLERPTLRPSVLSKVTYSIPEKNPLICHSFINEGKVQFLSDCTHKYAGQTLDLLEV